jgi:hypothetical protein
LLGVLAAAVSFSLLLLGEDRLSFVETLDKVSGDFRTALFAPAASAQRSDVTLVVIDEQTLRDYESVSPVDRRLIGKLLREIDAAGPRAIGVDFIFERMTSNTPALLDAIKDLGSPTVLGGLDDRYQGKGPSAAMMREGLRTQEEILAAAGRPAGHLWLERKSGVLATTVDMTVRLVGESFRGNPKRESFSAVLAKAAGYMHEPATRDISWLTPPDGPGTPLFAELRVPRHDPKLLADPTRPLISAAESDLLKGRIVLLGAALSDRDQHTTPLNLLDKQTVPGLWIHAQAVAQRIDATRDIKTIPFWAEFVILFAATIASFVVARILGFDHHAKAYSASLLLLLGLISIGGYVFWQLDLPSGSLTLASFAGVAAAHYADRISSWLAKREDAARLPLVKSAEEHS